MPKPVQKTEPETITGIEYFNLRLGMSADITSVVRVAANATLTLPGNPALEKTTGGASIKVLDAGKGIPVNDSAGDIYDTFDTGLFPNKHVYQRPQQRLAIPLTPKCYTTHKPLKIVKGGIDYFIYGGSCLDPVILDADIYVGFQTGMQGLTYPWDTKTKFIFPIVDGGVPASVQETKNLIAYLSASLVAGKKVHLGCIGGHGRTGLILAALVTSMAGLKESISYVRANYCAKAVESKTQVDWLNEHWGITKELGSKEYPKELKHLTPKATSPQKQKAVTVAPDGYHFVRSFDPIISKGNVWSL